jgi:hypothetical protein
LQGKRIPILGLTAKSTSWPRINAESRGFSGKQDFPFDEHARDPIARCGGGQVLQCVATHDMTNDENLAISLFQNLCQNLETHHDREV